MFQLAKALGVDANWLDAGKLTDYGMSAATITDTSSLREPAPSTHGPAIGYPPLNPGYETLSLRDRDVLEQLIAAYIRACRGVP